MKYDTKIVLTWFKEHDLHPEPEVQFAKHLGRKWRFDFLFDKMVVLEVEGGVWTGGRHTRGSGFSKDMEKYNTATMLGYRILRVTPQDLCTTETLEMVRTTLQVC